jgi:hypothetical protein
VLRRQIASWLSNSPELFSGMNPSGINHIVDPDLVIVIKPPKIELVF